MVNAFGEHKQHSHHDKCHMVMPGFPFPYLVVGHTTFTFRIFKYLLHPVALSLHPPQTLQSRTLRSIGQGNFEVRIFPNSLRRDYQLQKMSRIRFAVPHINFEARAPNFKVPSSGVAKRHRSPMSPRKRADNLSNFYAFLIGLIVYCRTAAFSHLIGKIGLWILQKYMKVRMQVDNKGFTHFIKREAKAGPLAVSRINSNPCVVKIVFPSIAHNFQRKLGFGAKHTILFRNTCPLATLRINRPIFRQVQPGINRCRKSTLHKGTKHRHLAVIDLTQPAQPLARDSDRPPALFRKAAFINEKARMMPIAQKVICITGNVINHLSCIPLRVGQKLLKVARFGFRYDFGHSIHFFSGTGLHQTGCIPPGFIRNVMAVRLEMFGIVIHKGHKAPADAGERRMGSCIRFDPFFR